MFGVLYDVSVWIPGDERSRTNPGHGFPERHETYKQFKSFKTEEELIDWVRVNNYRYKFVLMRYETLTVEQKISFKVTPTT